MKNDKSQFVVRTSDSYLLSSIVIGHLTHRRLYLGGREKKCIVGFQPAKFVLTQKELSRLRCRRDAGATIFSHDPCLRGETGRLCGRRLRSRQEIRCTFCCWPPGALARRGRRAYPLRYVR